MAESHRSEARGIDRLGRVYVSSIRDVVCEFHLLGRALPSVIPRGSTRELVGTLGLVG
jgi:hypothetical protein